MSRQLYIEDKTDLISGAYDPRTDWTADFGVDTKSGVIDTSKDEEIARRLQMEEENSRINYISPSGPAPLPEKSPLYVNRYAEVQATEARRRQKEAEKALEEERRRNQEAEKERKNKEYENELDKIREYNKLATDRALLRSTYNVGSYYLDPYERIYNWSLTLLPDYYDYMTRQRLRESLSRLIKRELRYHSTESELEDKIRNLIRDAEFSSSSEKKPRSKPRSKPRAKSKRISKAKSKRKSKK
jgi:hypothetical protein